MSQVNNILTYLKSFQFIQKLESLSFVRRIILFGSRARGDHNERADWDLAFYLTPLTSENWQEIIDIIDEADTLLKIDAICYNTLKEDSPIRKSIDKEGIIVHENIPMETKLKLSYEKLKKALDSLKVMVDKPMQKDRSNVDACIQRFEFTVELFWKYLKRLLESKGTIVTYPKEILKEAYQGTLIDDESLWLQMLYDRNQTSHTYNEELANKIYKNIVDKYYPLMSQTFRSLRQS